MQRVVGGVQVQDDLLGAGDARVQEQIDQQPLDRRAVMADLVVARGLARRSVLQTVGRRLAGQRRAARPACPELAHDRGQHRVVAQGVVVDQILVTQRQREHALADQGGHAVLDLIRRAVIDETGREPPDQADRPIGGAQEQRAGVGGNHPAIKSGHHRTALDACKLEPIRATVCRHRGTPLLGPKTLLQKNFRSFRAPMHLLPVRNPG